MEPNNSGSHMKINKNAHIKVPFEHYFEKTPQNQYLCFYHPAIVK